MSKSPTNRDGFNLVLAHFATDGQKHGAKAAMAKALGVTRAVTSIWETAGIPIKHIPKLTALTGLRGREMLPELWALLE